MTVTVWTKFALLVGTVAFVALGYGWTGIAVFAVYGVVAAKGQ